MERLLLFFTTAALIAANDNGVGLQPVMGWTGYNALMQSSGECAGNFYNESAFLESAAALKRTGLQALGYIYLNSDDCWLAWNRTASGELAADATRFPHGMAWLAAQLHSEGFKLGLYAAASLLTCRNYPGSQEHIELDARTFSEWGSLSALKPPANQQSQRAVLLNHHPKNPTKQARTL
jgi:hypothetical protein